MAAAAPAEPVAPLAGVTSSIVTVGSVSLVSPLLSLLSLLSPIFSRNAFGGFPYYNMVYLLDVRQIKTAGEYTGRLNQ